MDLIGLGTPIRENELPVREINQRLFQDSIAQLTNRNRD
jgi:hypothetical protein